MQTVEKALGILEVFLRHEDELGMAALANLSRLNISTTHRITSILVKRGYLNQRHKRGMYYLGLKLLEFDSTVKRRIKIRDVALPFLQELSKVTDESANLAILDANEAVYIEQIESKHNLRIFTAVGNRVPLHCTGVGKVFLAYMGQAEVERLFSEALPRYTENTITNFTQLKKQLLIVRQEGVAEDDEEMEVGVRCVASSVKDCDGNVVAAISVSGPSARLSGGRVAELRLLVKKCGLEISRVMGYREE